MKMIDICSTQSQQQRLKRRQWCYGSHLYHTLTLSFFSSVSGLGSRTFSLSDPSLKMSPKPIPRTFLGWVMTPFPEAGGGDVGVPLASMLLPSAGGSREKSTEACEIVPIVTLLQKIHIWSDFIDQYMLLNSNYILKCVSLYWLYSSIQIFLFFNQSTTAVAVEAGSQTLTNT